MPTAGPERSAAPRVRITRRFEAPFSTILTAARTCYSPRGIVRDEDLGPGGEPLARELYDAGHHTTIQHAYFQFAIENVSRQFLWSFLHAHPFYNSEQVSQRYVRVEPSSCLVPPIEGKALALYFEALEEQFAFYGELRRDLAPLAGAACDRRFPARARKRQAHPKDVERKAQEVARYVLPVATFAALYHTVSALTLLRYQRVCEQPDAPWEQRIVVGKMIEALLEADPRYRAVLEGPIPSAEYPEAEFFAANPDASSSASRAVFAREFDESLKGRVSRLVDWTARGEEETARAVRAVLGVPASALSDDEAIELAVSPTRSRVLGDALNLTTLGKLSRAMHHASYTFRRKISHAADSQDQRHRMTPASRPILAAHVTGEPDFVTPALVREDPAVEARYAGMMARVWERIGRLRRLGVSEEFASYLLPNAVAVRYAESADFLALRHKHVMRLCYLAQEEIWRASVDEAEQIREVHPRLGRHLLPPCGVRKEAGARPWCPEGARFCGERVWSYPLSEYRRVI